MINTLYKQFLAWMDYNPPASLSITGWRLFKAEFRVKAPLRYWLKYKFRHDYILPIIWKAESIQDWIRYRTVSRYHILKSGLPPGYHSISQQMLYVNFNMLKDFVEVEQAWCNWCWSDSRQDTEQWHQKIWPFSFFFKHTYRNPELGLEYFRWSATLDDPKLPAHERCDAQAANAREIIELYDWWVNKRPARKDLVIPRYDNQGIDSIFDSLDTAFDRNAEDYKEYTRVVDEQNKLDQTREVEDEEMLVRLMKIRNALWT